MGKIPQKLLKNSLGKLLILATLWAWGFAAEASEKPLTVFAAASTKGVAIDRRSMGGYGHGGSQ